MLNKINLTEKFSLIHEYWDPKIISDLNESHVKLAKLKGEFVWHKHDAEDELFFVVQGNLLIRFRDSDVWLEPGELLVIPRGVEHKPVAQEEVQVMLVEPRTTVNTGDTDSHFTRQELDWI